MKPPELSTTSRRYLRALEAYVALVTAAIPYDADTPAHQRARLAIREAADDTSWIPVARAFAEASARASASAVGTRKVVRRDPKGLVLEVIEFSASAAEVQRALGTR